MTTFTRATDGPWWHTGVLERPVHGPLIAAREAVARRSGLGLRIAALWTKMPETLPPAARLWAMETATNVRDTTNVCFTGDAIQAAEHMVTLTGMLLRNFIDARMLTLDAITDELWGDEGHQWKATVLLIPDFCLAAETAKKSDRQLQALVSLLRARHTQRLPTVVFADLKALAGAYSPAFADLVAENFVEVDGSTLM